MELISDIEKLLSKSIAIDFRKKNYSLFKELNKTCVVIDDDPTGNQTVHGVTLLTKWDENSLEEEFKKGTVAFFVLTNSRSLTTQKAAEIYAEITENIIKVSQKTKRKYTIISRSDSTLRGHFLAEIEAIQNVKNNKIAITAFIPLMFEGGRITVHDVHYIKEKKHLLPVGESSFAQDHTFRYLNSDLKKWIEEKTKGKIKASQVVSFSVNSIREQSIKELSEKVLGIESGSFCIVNAFNYSDLDKMTQAFIIYRSSSSFVPSYIGLFPRDLLNISDIKTSNSCNGGLVIVGSYVSKSSEQLQYVLNDNHQNNVFIEIDVNQILLNSNEGYLEAIISEIDHKIGSNKNCIVFTSRKVITGKTNNETIDIAVKISNALISIVQKIKNRPKYILAKGGITSHDIAVKGLGMKKSKTIGQISLGIPVWEMGEETKFPKMRYIVFPGNVGKEKTLNQLINKLNLV